jgi:hypothetical protein
MAKTYDYKNCQSLFGYAQKVHERSGGICQLCGCGATLALDSDEYFDLWRQMTVEHLVGKAKKGYLKDLRIAVEQHFSEFSPEDLQWVVDKIDEANTVTACSLCNSMTSRDSNLKTTKAMTEILNGAHGSPQEVVEQVTVRLNEIRDRKKNTVAWKLESVRKAFREKVESKLLAHLQRSSGE